MTSKRGERIPILRVETTQGKSGALAKDSHFVFTYDPQVIAADARAQAVSLTMPLRATPWQSGAMLPAFQTFLPEGFLRERIRERFAKTMRMDDMAMLALSSTNAIGRIRMSLVSDDDHKTRPPSPVESLGEVLADQGSRDLFEYLCDRYLMASGVSGVQPKVLLEAEPYQTPASQKLSPAERSLRAHRLIVKISGPEYPGLCENEFHCMQIAKHIGLEAPTHWLSEDTKRFVVERFDYNRARDCYLGFEDMVALQGRVNERKYEGSYESIALAIKNNVSPLHLHTSLLAYFRQLVLCVLVRNGDAHLKNFGLLYSDPTTDDCKLSPVYDLVCTTAFIPADLMALKLSGSRAWPSAAALIEFGRTHCGIKNAKSELGAVVDAAMSYAPVASDDMWKTLRALIASAAMTLAI